MADRWFGLAVLVLAGSLVGGCGDDDESDGGSGNPAGVGNSCAVDEACPTGECYLGPGGGYCTAECEAEGSTASCPVDTVCKPIQGGPLRCLLVCGSESACSGVGPEDCGDAYCPQGSSCVAVSDTDLRGCEPDPG